MGGILATKILATKNSFKVKKNPASQKSKFYSEWWRKKGKRIEGRGTFFLIGFKAKI